MGLVRCEVTSMSKKSMTLDLHVYRTAVLHARVRAPSRQFVYAVTFRFLCFHFVAFSVTTKLGFKNFASVGK